ncbi:hypothetical protein F3Y22_tig00003731pilonHSYRG00012 [Hibiscus syriacus]|uniref:Uncharacterized protein n=1 Tax=Hibiscus syriacus TaxID=106335 RepID=A0A6A3CIM3_HIBSY|nr:hypothetical protein F3Y22_tig00003731pilonHSYRG00012 [Hibiscus syriacus]
MRTRNLTLDQSVLMMSVKDNTQEKQLCSEIRILPAHSLSMLQTLSIEIMKGNISKKSDARNLLKVEASKVDKVYDMLVKKGLSNFDQNSASPLL